MWLSMRPGMRNSFGRNRVIRSSMEYLTNKQSSKCQTIVIASMEPLNSLANIILRADSSPDNRPAIVDDEKSVGLHPEAPVGKGVHQSPEDGETASLVLHRHQSIRQTCKDTRELTVNVALTRAAPPIATRQSCCPLSSMTAFPPPCL